MEQIGQTSAVKRSREYDEEAERRSSKRRMISVPVPITNEESETSEESGLSSVGRVIGDILLGGGGFLLILVSLSFLS